MKYIYTFPKKEKVVSMLQFKGQLIIATEWHLYRVIDDKFVCIPIKIKKT